MVIAAGTFGFGFGRVWWPIAVSCPIPRPDFVGVIVLSVLGGMGLSGMKWLPSLGYGLCMFAGFGIAAVL
ncbi:MAG: hypothetical protein PHI23_03075 [Candidatus Peribacteraceae bacterium]|nr:hypothetical protein [Candidatus Peribacteraceae bacterium]